jgi:hypothetical protein
MEMIDVLNKLQEIADKSPEVAKAIESVKQTNPKEVSENAVESEAPTNKEPVKEYEDKIQEYKVGTFKDFLASKGRDIYKLKSDEYSKYAQEYKAEREKAQQDATAHKGTDDHRELTRIAKYDDVDPTTTEGGMSDIHIGAEEVVGEFIDDNGNLTMRKAEVLGAMDKEKANAPFPRSYEIETAMRMIQDDFNDNGSRKHEIDEPEGIDGLGDSAVQEDAGEDEKVVDMLRNIRQHLDNHPNMNEHPSLVALDQLADDLESGDKPADYESVQEKELNTNTMATEDKKQVNEDIQISTDSPEEAGVMMQILKLAGVKPVDDAMINAEPEAEVNPEHGDEGHDHSDCPVCGDDAVGSNDMAKMRDVITAPDEEKAEETFANEPDEKVSDVDTLVNVHSGGLNKQKQQVRKEYPGDNPLASKYETVEDKVSEEDLSNSLRTQYEGWKKSYKEAAKVAEAKAKPDFLDMDKDGDKKEPMKKAIADKK